MVITRSALRRSARCARALPHPAHGARPDSAHSILKLRGTLGGERRRGNFIKQKPIYAVAPVLYPAKILKVLPPREFDFFATGKAAGCGTARTVWATIVIQRTRAA